MKKVTFLVILVLITSIASAQVNKRVSAFNYLDDGDLDLAKETIDKCVKHSKTIKDPKAWMYYGQIYQQLSTTEDKAYKGLEVNPEIKSFEGYKNAMLYNFKDPSFHNLNLENEMDIMTLMKGLNDPNAKIHDSDVKKNVFVAFPVLANLLVNKGLLEYQESKKYKESLELFEKALLIMPFTMKLDTQLFYFCALAAVKSEETDKAIGYYTVLTEMNYGETEVDKANNYYFLAKQYLVKDDNEKYIETIEKGIEKYPNSSTNLVVEMINLYLKTDQAKALEYLNKGISAAPNNASLYLVKGNIYNTDSLLEDKDKALEAYLKVVEIDSVQFDAYYNIGGIYFNKGAEKNEEANNVDPDDFKKYKAVKAKADGIFKQALPYLEKAHAIDPKDMATMQSLKLIYYRIGELEKSNAMKAKMEGK